MAAPGRGTSGRPRLPGGVLFLLIRRPTGDRLLPGVQHPVLVVGVEHPLPPVFPKFLKREPRVVAPLEVAVVERAVRRSAPDLHGNRIEYLVGLFLRLLPFSHVAANGQDVRAALVGQGRPPRLHPPPLAARQAHSPDQPLLTPGQDVREPSLRGVAVLGGRQVGEPGWDLTEEVLDGRVGVGGIPCRVEEADEVERVLRGRRGTTRRVRAVLSRGEVASALPGRDQSMASQCPYRIFVE